MCVCVCVCVFVTSLFSSHTNKDEKSSALLVVYVLAIVIPSLIFKELIGAIFIFYPFSSTHISIFGDPVLQIGKRYCEYLRLNSMQEGADYEIVNGSLLFGLIDVQRVRDIAQDEREKANRMLYRKTFKTGEPRKKWENPNRGLS